MDDILQAVEFIKQSGHQKIGLVGSSFGGMASIMAASKTPDLSVLALKSPVSDYLGKLMTISLVSVPAFCDLTVALMRALAELSLTLRM